MACGERSRQCTASSSTPTLPSSGGTSVCPTHPWTDNHHTHWGVHLHTPRADPQHSLSLHTGASIRYGHSAATTAMPDSSMTSFYRRKQCSRNTSPPLERTRFFEYSPTLVHDQCILTFAVLCTEDFC